ncbi:NusG domain II-containing protein [Salisediminibacterium halotolerans]|uniref:Uncharacterized protein n=1 Tax=Salisediminibacterium halotolerans TaxID=517425 RepID=A0A1H9TA48_9BACI|nr:NusG domain II-containing protein [Salisediminibacterium haloalkalitolerans]SER93998.1 hypothetical protein SAMN05444126_10956 [Salisediminibacterium haloalkalitolerans]
MNWNKKMKRGDFLMLLGTGAVAGGLFLFTGSTDWFRRFASDDDDPLTATIEQDGNVIEELDLNAVTKAREIPLDNDLNVKLAVEPGRIRFIESDCPDNICINSGWLSNIGDNAVCLPARTVVSII